MKKLIALLTALMMLVSCSLALAEGDAAALGEAVEAFEAIEGAVVAEGIGYTNWGYDMNMLWQEYEGGEIRIYVACVMEGQASVLVTFDGVLVKGVDEDGDPELVLTINGATMEMGGIVLDGSGWIDEIELLTNTYDEETGEYSFPLSFSLMGYTVVNADIDVAPVEEATDVAEWVAQYIPAAE